MIVGLFLGLLVLLMISGLPLFACFTIVCVGLIITLGYSSEFAVPCVFHMLNSFTIMAIPFFVFAGGLMSASGISEKIVGFAHSIVGRIKGGLGAVTIISSGFFGAISGSSGAAISGVGMAILPELDKHGYQRKYSTALLACSGLLGQLIPPSVPLILFGMITATSVAACWLGAAVPGLILIIFYLVINHLHCRKIPEIQTLEKVSAKKAIKGVAASARRGLFALIMPVIILGGIYSGTFTPTEAGAIAVLYALLVGFIIYRKLSSKNFVSVSREVISVLGSITFIIFFIIILSRIFTYERLPMILGDTITGISSNPVITLLLINLLLLFVGMIMDDVSGMLIMAPLLFPLFMQLGIHPVQMAAIMAVNQGTGMLTPPVATNLYVASRIGNVPASDFIKHTIPFLIFGNLPILLMTTFIPEVSLWLPSLVMDI